MKLIVCSVFDQAVAAYLPPFFVRSKGEALRVFMDACADTKHQFNQHGTDYALMLLGEFDDVQGCFEAPLAPVCLLTGLEALARNASV